MADPGYYYFQTTDDANGNWVDSQSYGGFITCTTGGNITSIGVKLASLDVPMSFKFALYNDADHAQLSSGGTQAGVANQWNDYTLATPVTVVDSQVVIPMVHNSAGDFIFRIKSVGNDACYLAITYASFPPANLAAHGTTDYHAQFRVYVAEVAGGTHYTEDISHDGSWNTMTTATLSRSADYKRAISHS